MRKIVLFFAFFLSVSAASYAFVDNKYMMTPQYLENTGYSGEVSKMILVVGKDPYQTPEEEGTSFKDIIKRGYNYIVPTAYTDLDFYNHNIQFNGPSWRDF